MIGNKSEVMPILDISKDKFSEESDFLYFINNKKKDKKNRHGEDINIEMTVFFPKPYYENIYFTELNGFFTSQENKKDCHNVNHNNTTLNQQKKYFYSMPLVLKKEHESGMMLKKTDGISLRSTSRIHTDESIYTGGNDYKESNKEIAKSYFPYSQLRNDIFSHRQQVIRKDIQQRKLKSPVTGNLLKNNIDVTAKNAPIKNKYLSLDYPFLRWTGEHSVKVFIPMDKSPSRYLTLLPSDQRLAEVLARQVGQLNGFTTELLNPREDEEESEKRDAQYNEEEEKE